MNSHLQRDVLPVPQPGPGEVLVKTLGCNICGSDLHALKHTRERVEGAQRSSGHFIIDLDREVVLGHECCAEIINYGPGSQHRLTILARLAASVDITYKVLTTVPPP